MPRPHRPHHRDRRVTREAGRMGPGHVKRQKLTVWREMSLRTQGEAKASTAGWGWPRGTGTRAGWGLTRMGALEPARRRSVAAAGFRPAVSTHTHLTNGSVRDCLSADRSLYFLHPTQSPHCTGSPTRGRRRSVGGVRGSGQRTAVGSHQ